MLANAFRGSNVIKFDNYTGRYKSNTNKADFSTPSYDPSFKLVQKRNTAGAFDFAKVASRKLLSIPTYCKNQYNVNYDNPVIKVSNSVPNFKKMNGR